MTGKGRNESILRAGTFFLHFFGTLKRPTDVKDGGQTTQVTTQKPPCPQPKYSSSTGMGSSVWSTLSLVKGRIKLKVSIGDCRTNRTRRKFCKAEGRRYNLQPYSGVLICCQPPLFQFLFILHHGQWRTQKCALLSKLYHEQAELEIHHYAGRHRPTNWTHTQLSLSSAPLITLRMPSTSPHLDTPRDPPS